MNVPQAARKVTTSDALWRKANNGTEEISHERITLPLAFTMNARSTKGEREKRRDVP